MLGVITGLSILAILSILFEKEIPQDGQDL
jgi:hypothetical protein